MTKFCIICGKPLMGMQRKLCFNIECHKERKREIARNYFWNKREERLEHNRELYYNNHEREKKRKRDYRQNNLEKIKEYQYEYRQNNLESLKERGREYRRNNREKISEDRREHYQNNREEERKRNRKSYHSSRGLPEDADLHKESSLERIMREWLQENSIEFVPQYYINLENSTWTWVDFYIPELNICLYVDGGYYHLLPNAKKCDVNQNKILPQMGYNIIRISEAEILEGNKIWSRLAQYLEVGKNG